MKSINDELPNLKRLVQMLAAQFGKDSEIVLHDLSREYEHTIVAIENNWITGRKVGDGGTNLGLEVLRNPPSAGGDLWNYYNRTPEGRVLRSSTLYFRDDQGKVIGSLCINTDITRMAELQKALQEFTLLPPSEEQEVEEIFTSRVEDLINYLLKQSEKKAGKNAAEMGKEDKIEALRFLDSKGFFLITGSGDEAHKFFGISKFTLYKYLGIIRGKSFNEISAETNENTRSGKGQQ
ncbi:MAG: helix-turn-helix transcriptional regulator [Treponema sp.]|jgi:predicted transcriptional regulator YheO|nr:helix-turn-helix transcriptional regulator [Treponema sp.]